MGCTEALTAITTLDLGPSVNADRPTYILCKKVRIVHSPGVVCYTAVSKH